MQAPFPRPKLLDPTVPTHSFARSHISGNAQPRTAQASHAAQPCALMDPLMDTPLPSHTAPASAHPGSHEPTHVRALAHTTDIRHGCGRLAAAVPQVTRYRRRRGHGGVLNHLGYPALSPPFVTVRLQEGSRPGHGRVGSCVSWRCAVERPDRPLELGGPDRSATPRGIALFTRYQPSDAVRATKSGGLSLFLPK